MVFRLRAQSSCDGADINPLPNLVNLGITYNVPAAVDKSRLQIVLWNGSSWTNVDTVPDPVAGNPYVSATINHGNMVLLGTHTWGDRSPAPGGRRIGADEAFLAAESFLAPAKVAGAS